MFYSYSFICEALLMVDNMIDGVAESDSIETGQRRRHTNQSRHVTRLLLPHKAEMLQGVHIARGNDMMSLIDEDELEALWIEFGNAISRRDTSHGGNGDICMSCSVEISHFDLNRLCRVSTGAMSSRLLNKLPPVNKDKGLSGSILPRLDAIDELSKDNLYKEF